MNTLQKRAVRCLVRLTSIALAPLLLALTTGSASAASDHTCDRVADETITVDGMIDDWSGFSGRRIGKKSANRGLVVRCAYDKARLYVLLDVSDDRVIRGRKGNTKREDWVSAKIWAPGGKAIKLTAFPGTRGFKPKVVGGKKAYEVADSRQSGGFTTEISIPLKKVSKWTKSLPALRGQFRFGDFDGKAGKGVLSGTVRLQFSDADAVFKSFLRATGLSRSEIRYDVLRDVNMGDGAERVVFGGNIIGVLSDSFIFMRLPVADAKDIIKVKVVNFSGSGRAQIVAHFRQHGNGSRDLVAVWNIDSDRKFDRLLAVEVRKELGGRIIENKWSLVRAGSLRAKPAKKKRRGYDLVVEASGADGFSKDNYLETRSADEDPILLPWASEDNSVYFFDGDSLAGKEPMAAKLREKRKKAAKKAAAKKATRKRK